MEAGLCVCQFGAHAPAPKDEQATSLGLAYGLSFAHKVSLGIWCKGIGRSRTKRALRWREGISGLSPRLARANPAMDGNGNTVSELASTGATRPFESGDLDVTLGVVVLAHEHLERTAQVARWLGDQGARVVVHVDRAHKRHDDLIGHHPNVDWCGVRRVHWGTWSVVDATLHAAERLLATQPDVTHVCLISGDSIPIKPLETLSDFLARNPATDFIESVSVTEASWVRDGLEQERFSLFFPAPWKRRKWLFDALVRVQRLAGVQRKVPDDLAPHIGGQWWCLTRKTLTAILGSKRRERYRRFFKYSWIPDEAYFQTLVRRYSECVSSQSLILAEFDAKGCL